MKYWNLAGCGNIELEGGKTYSCGDGGGNIIFLDGSIYEDSGNGTMEYTGTAIPKTMEEFTSAPNGDGKIVWDDTDYVLTKQQQRKEK